MKALYTHTHTWETECLPNNKSRKEHYNLTQICWLPGKAASVLSPGPCYILLSYIFTQPCLSLLVVWDKVSCSPGQTYYAVGGSWTSDPPVSQVLELQVCVMRLFYSELRRKLGASQMLGKHSSNWATPQAPSREARSSVRAWCRPLGFIVPNFSRGFHEHLDSVQILPDSLANSIGFSEPQQLKWGLLNRLHKA